MTDAHPPADDLVAYARGLLGEAEAEAVSAHLERCPVCAAVADGVSPDTFAAAVAAHAHPPDLTPGTRPADPDRTRLAGPADDPASVWQKGEVIAGRYKLIDRIGEGGMGTVWRAEQTAPVRREVAVKVMQRKGDSDEFLARFEAERQALAVMDHPNIAKVLDGGVHHGRPYFVMELVKGVPITQFCDERMLTPKQRLELFVPVCQAIQHAHMKGVIHRDVKPSNVLVALYDDTPVPKVIDFGIAKAVGVPLTEQTLNTGFGRVMGTPAYMSPEQATLNNLDIDTRSDVYALGVLLYELLTGGPPLSGERLSREALDEVLRLVREEEPPRPSQRLSTADTRASISAVRGTEPARLTALVRGELDWVVMKALEKDRGRRYESAAGFAADVQRYLAGEPVQAHPPSAAYRLRKFVRRHRGPVIAAAIVAAAVLFGVTAAIVGLTRALAAEKVAFDAQTAQRTAERNEAQERETRLRADLEASARLALASGDVRKMLAVLDDMEKRGLAFTPELRLERAAAYQTLGDHTGVERELAATEAAALAPKDRARVAMLRAEELVFVDYPRADELFGQAEALGVSEADREYLRGLRVERSRDALAAFNKAIETDQRHLPARQMAAFTALFLGQRDEAERLVREARLLYPEHPGIAAASAVMQAAQKNTAEADAEFARARDRLGNSQLATFALCFRALFALPRAGEALDLIALRRLGGEFGAIKPKQLVQLGGDGLPPCWRAVARLALTSSIIIGGPDPTKLNAADIIQLAAGLRPPERVPTPDELTRFSQDLELHPEGMLTFFYGYALFDQANGDDRNNPEAAPKFLRAAKEFDLALQRPMIVDLRAATLDMIAGCYVKARVATPSAVEADKLWAAGGRVVAKRYREYGVAVTGGAQLATLIMVAAMGGQSEIARIFLAERRKLEPKHPSLSFWEAVVQDKLGNPTSARDAAALSLANQFKPPWWLPDLDDIFTRANIELLKIGTREMLPPPRPEQETLPPPRRAR